MDIMPDALWSTFTSRQKLGESLQDYTRQFNISTEILESYLVGSLILDKYVKTIEVYNETNTNKTNTMVKHSLESMFVYLYLYTSDNDKYGSII